MSDTLERFRNLRDAAGKANPDEWIANGLTVMALAGTIARIPTSATDGLFDCSDNAKYIALANPATITALLAVAEERDKEADLLDIALTNKNESVIALEAKVEEQQKEVERLAMRLMQTRENLVIVRMQDYMDLSAEDAAAQLYSLWMAAVHQPHAAHPENVRIAELEAKLAAMEEVVQAARKLADAQVYVLIPGKHVCQQCLVTDSRHNTLRHQPKCPVGVVLGFAEKREDGR